MDYAAAIERVYAHLEDDRVDRAAMTCLRIARSLRDNLSAAVFLHEMYPGRREFARILYDDTNDLKPEARKFLHEKSLEQWLEIHTLDFTLAGGGEEEDGEERNVLAISVNELDTEIEQCEKWISDMSIPAGMGEYDTAAFTDRYVNRKQQMRLRIKAVLAIKQRIKTKCLNYAIRIERQLQAQRKPQSFLEDCQNEVNNFFKAHAEDVYRKLQRATQLVDSHDPEDLSLLLTEVRRAMKAAADYFYPPVDGFVECSDGKQRELGSEQYLNRLHEHIARTFATSSSRDLLRAEYEYLAVFARKLNDIAAKGVHADVGADEAKQGLIGLYMFLYNVVSRTQRDDSGQIPDKPSPVSR